MSDYKEGPHGRDRYRRHKNRIRHEKKDEKENILKEAVDKRTNSSLRTSPKVRQSEAPVLRKIPALVCARCGQPIQDITSALADKETGEPVHFDCVLNFLKKTENLDKNERIVYIGQGCFAVVFFENPVDTRKFRIVRTIEWERHDVKPKWREDISNHFSQIK